MTTAPLLLSAALCLAAPPAQEAAGVRGDWEGTLSIKPAPTVEIALRLVLRVTGRDDALKATFQSPDQNDATIDVDSITRDGRDVAFEVKRIKGKYAGKLSADGSTIEGTWTQGAMANPLILKRFDPAKAAAAAEPPKEVEGAWEGPLQLPGGIELRLVVRVEKPKDGPRKAVMDSPDQGAKDIPVQNVKLDKGTLSFEVRSIAGKFTGALNDKKTEAKGTWSQGGQEFPLTLKKTDKVSESRRPQLPKAPFPYRAEEVSYANARAEGVKLAGTLTLPKGDGPFPAVVLITGSGAQDRDETLLGHKPFLVLADDLTRRGIAVLRADDRGVGGSTGDHAKATSADFATDALAGVAYLKARPEIDPRRIGLAGHSEGGLIAPIAAAQSDDVAFLVLIAGPGVPGGDILVAQSELIARAMGAKDEAVARNLAALKKVLDVVKTQADDDAVASSLKAIAREVVEALSDDERKELGGGAAGVEARITMLASPWFRYFLTYDPRPTLAKVHCPVLAINGEKDLQVPAKDNLAAIASALRAGGNARFVTKELPGLNHLLQTCKTGAPSEYSKIEETMAPEALKTIGDWIVETTGVK